MWAFTFGPMTPEKRDSTLKRHEIVRSRFNEISSQRLNGMRLDYQDMVRSVADGLGYSEIYVVKILKGRA